MQFQSVLSMVFVLRHFVDCSDSKFIVNPDSNILTKALRDSFDFTIYPPQKHAWGHGRNVADERQWLHSHTWTSYGFQTTADSEGVAYIKVNLKRPYYVKAFAITGYASGSYKPTGSYFLEGSNDGADWKMVAEGKAEQWHAPGTYPFRSEQIIPAIYPGRYKQYRVIARGWTNDNMLIYNWGLFT